MIVVRRGIFSGIGFNPSWGYNTSGSSMVGISYRDIYDMFLMLRDVIPMLRPHPPGCGSLLVDVYDM